MIPSNNSVTYTKPLEFGYVENNTLSIHRYGLKVTVIGPARYADNLVIITFEDLGALVTKVTQLFNSSIIYNDETYINTAICLEKLKSTGVNIQKFPSRLYIENFCEYIALQLQDALNIKFPGVIVQSVHLSESPRFSASWERN